MPRPDVLRPAAWRRCNPNGKGRRFKSCRGDHFCELSVSSLAAKHELAWAGKLALFGHWCNAAYCPLRGRGVAGSNPAWLTKFTVVHGMSYFFW